jgi:hypothetical protein
MLLLSPYSPGGAYATGRPARAVCPRVSNKNLAEKLQRTNNTSATWARLISNEPQA